MSLYESVESVESVALLRHLSAFLQMTAETGWS